MQDKIREIMTLLDIAVAEAEDGQPTFGYRCQIESKLRELVREPLEDCDMWDVACKNIDANEFSLYELNAMFEIGRNVERAHNITKASGVE